MIGNVDIDGNVTATGQVSDIQGSLDEMRQIYNAHAHPSDGATPTNTMS